MADLETVELNPEGKTTSAVIWLHGLGADGHDFAGLIPELNLPDDSGIRFIFPHAPHRPVTLNGGMSMPAWYDIFELSREAKQDHEGLEETRGSIESLIAREVDAGIPAERIVLAGFSQGGAAALYTGLRQSQRIAGILALSTWLPLAERVRDEGTEANREVPILMAHGNFDPVVQIEWGKKSRDALQEMGYEIDWREYPMPHAVHPEEVSDISQWLQQVLEN